MKRFLGYFRGISFRKDGIHIAQTGAVIPMDRVFFYDFYKVVLFNAYILAMRFGRFLRRVPQKGTIAFTPQPAGPWFNAWMAAYFAGLKIVNGPEKADHIFVFDDSTHSTAGAEIPAGLHAHLINENITDISKEYVGELFETVFGYGVRIDPTQHTGPAVQKSNANGTHDGLIVECPLAPEDVIPGQAYQKLIDSTFNGNQAEDLRIIFAFGEIPVVFHKFKDLEKRFSMDYAHVDVKPADQAFSGRERELIIGYCEKIGLDFGAVDILRDKNDGRIYIVDVNKTCMPVLCLSIKEQAGAFRRIGDAFSRGLKSER